VSTLLLRLVTESAYMGILFAFLFAFLEALPIIGTFIPGIALMSIVGYWIGANLISFQTALLASFIGALLGDYISYWIGLKYENSIYKFKYFQNKIHYINIAKTKIEKYGALAIIVGRFFGPVRSSVPLIAGLLSLSRINRCHTFRFIMECRLFITWYTVRVGCYVFTKTFLCNSI